MAQASISGLNSGLDTNDILTKLVALQRRPIDLVQAKRDAENQKLAAFQELKSRLQTFKSVVSTLNTQNRFLSTQGIFSNNSSTDNNQVLSLTTTSQAASGTFSLTVNKIARESKLISAGFSSTTASVEQGTLEITVGNTTTKIAINSANNTLDGVRLAINNSGADVTASFLNDGSSTNPVRLLVSGTKTGKDNSVSLAIKKGFLGGGTQELVSFTETQAAQDASLVVDGVSVTKSTNTITDVINGTTLNLQSAGSGTITLSSDLDAIKEKITSFVDGYNELTLFLNDQQFLNPDSLNTGLLFGNFTVQNLQQTIRNTVSAQVGGVSGTFNFLSQVGIRTQDDGTLKINDTDLTSALNTSVGNVSQLFSSLGTTTDNSVTFVGFTKETVAGTYDLRVSGGVPQLSPTGKNQFTNAVGSGNFFSGAPGTDAEGLNFRIANLGNGSYGTITLSVGVAETINRVLANLVDTSLNGPLSAEIDTATESIKDFDETIASLEERVTVFEASLRQRFTNLEITIGKLNSQKEAFTNSLTGLQNLFKK
ncbi:MAG: flagellar filament capping protein FliD [Nitrospinaceae bacterium]